MKTTHIKFIMLSLMLFCLSCTDNNGGGDVIKDISFYLQDVSIIDSKKIKLTFSKPINSEKASQIKNYEIESPTKVAIKPVEVVLNSDKELELALNSELNEEGSYTIYINNLKAKDGGLLKGGKGDFYFEKPIEKEIIEVKKEQYFEITITKPLDAVLSNNNGKIKVFKNGKRVFEVEAYYKDTTIKFHFGSRTRIKTGNYKIVLEDLVYKDQTKFSKTFEINYTAKKIWRKASHLKVKTTTNTSDVSTFTYYNLETQTVKKYSNLNEVIAGYNNKEWHIAFALDGFLMRVFPSTSFNGTFFSADIKTYKDEYIANIWCVKDADDIFTLNKQKNTTVPFKIIDRQSTKYRQKPLRFEDYIIHFESIYGGKEPPKSVPSNYEYDVTFYYVKKVKQIYHDDPYPIDVD